MSSGTVRHFQDVAYYYSYFLLQTGSLMRRGPPRISQKTFVIIIGTSVSAGVLVLVVLLVALVWCYVRRRKLKLASEEKGDTTVRSPAHSFIQYPPKLVGTSSDIISDVPSTPFSSSSISKATPEERYLENAITWPTHVRSKLSQDSGLGGSSLRTSATSNGGAGPVLSGITAVHVSLDTTLTDESTKLTNSTTPISPSKGSSVLPSVAEKLPLAEPPSGSLEPSSVIKPSLLSPALETEPTQSHTSKMVGSQIVTVDSTPETPSTPNELVSLPRSETMPRGRPSIARSTSNNLVSLPPRETSVPPSANAYSTYPGLPSSPAALLTSSQITLKQDEIPPVPRNPFTSAAFLDRPPGKKSREGSQSRKHSRSLSQPFSTPAHIATGQGSSKESSEVKSIKYASVAYAQAKATESARSRSKSAQASARTPRAKGDRTPIDMQSPKPDKELFALLSSRSRTRPRSHSWSTGGNAPEMI